MSSPELVRVLLLDDDQDSLNILSHHFDRMTRSRYEVTTCKNSHDALQLLSDQPFDVAVFDYELAEPSNGAQVIELAEHQGIDIPIIIITGLDSYEIEVDAVMKGATDFLHKDEITAQVLERSIHVAFVKREAYRRLHKQATIDELTGAYNRQAFIRHAETEIARAVRYGHSLSLMVIDGDNIKDVNDSYGHAVGDIVIHAMANRILDCVREIDIVGRYGGDEFLLLMPETDQAEADHVASRMLSAIAEKPIQTAGGAVSVTASLGVATLIEKLSDYKALFDAADHAAYTAKADGRNCAVYWATDSSTQGSVSEKR